MKSIPALLLLVCLFVCCSPAKRLERLVSRHPDLVSSDTIYASDTTILTAVRADTSFVFTSSPNDTFYLDRDRLSVRVIRSTDTLLINAECKADTIIKEIPVQVNSVQPVKQFSLFQKIAGGICVLCFIVLLIVAFYCYFSSTKK